MRRMLLTISILVLASACSRDAAENRDPGGDPARPMAESAPVTQTQTAATTTTTTTTPPTTTHTTATGTQQP